MEQIERQRKILSGITESEMNVEYLMDENDLHYVMKREEFNAICQPSFAKIQQMELTARDFLKEKAIEVHSVEMVGGGSRIPEFIRIAKEIFTHEPSRTLNSNESVARGSALMAAIKSPLFRVAEYTLNEKAVYGIKFSWNFVEGSQLLGTNSALYPEKQRKMIFEAGSKVPSSKTIKFSRKEGIEMVIEYEPQVPGFTKTIGYFVTKPQQPKE
jgi:molecular chaperone DnaK (HSP70)